METPPLGSIEQAEKNLYSKKHYERGGLSRHLSEKDYKLKTDWGENKNMPISNKKTRSFWHNFFIFSIIFFIFALVLSAFIFWRGSNIISSNNVDIVVNGPVAVSAGEEMSFQIGVLNRNNVNLESTTLLVEFPAGTVKADNPEESMPRYSEDLGVVKSGEKYQKVVKAILFGEENDKKTIKITVEYRVEGSNAIFQKEKSYDLVISSAPMSLLVSGPSNASAGTEVELAVDLVANTDKPISNAAVLVNYPFGFIYKEADPAPTASNNFWNFGTLKAGDNKKIVVKGLMDGQNNEERVFRVEAGSGDRNRINTLFTSFMHSIVIAKPALALSTAVSGKSDRTVVFNPGEQLRIDLRWQNNLKNQISNATAVSTLKTNGFPIEQISPSYGFFRSSDQSVVWTKDRVRELSLMNPGEEGTLSYNLRLPNLSALANSRGIFENPNIKITSEISGNDLASSDDSNPRTVDERIIKIASPLTVSGTIFKKSGSTYTLVLTVKNPFNNMTGVKLSGSLPTYVKWKNSYTPNEETVSFNSFGGEMLWNLGKVPAGTGYSRSSRQLTIDLEVDTSLSGLSSSLMNNIKISGDDSYTGTKVEYKLASVNLGS